MLKPFVHAAFGAVAIVAVASSAQAAAGTTVNVTLWDKGAMAEMATDHGMGKGTMMSGDRMASNMGIELSAETVQAGDITFEVTNSSKDTVHEMVVFPYKDGETFPYSESESKIDEDAAGHLGEVAELEPGKSGALRISLKPGKYALICNIAGHYLNGMWAILTVK